MSVDPAHSLADAFDLSTDLFQDQTADPFDFQLPFSPARRYHFL
jgi:hypothetical protein